MGKLTFISKLNNVKLLYWMLGVGFVLLVVTFVAWLNIVHMSPKNVFNGMISNNLSVSGYTRQVSSTQNGMNSQEIGQIQTGGLNTVQTITKLDRDGEKVETQSIGVDGAEYVRYNQISTTQKTAAGKEFDFSKVKGVWSKNESAGMSSSFQQLLLGIVPMGNTSPEVRAKIKKFMSEHPVYVTDYKSVKKESKDGRKYYTYEVQIMPQTYIEVLKMYAPSVGLGNQVKDLDPKDYAEAEATNITLTVDALSRDLVSIKYPDSDRVEKFSGYGINKTIKTPTKHISGQELQQRINDQN